mgnify:CR=1 FL=1
MSNSKHKENEAEGISIVTPFYNTGVVFWETYASVLNQHLTNWEWIIVNDGSTSAEALQILQELVQKENERFLIVHCSTNEGLPAARNRGVTAASNNFIFFLDADDLIDPDYLEKAWITLQLNSSFAFVNSWSTGFGSKQYLWPVGLERRAAFLKENQVAFCGLFRKSVFDKIQFNETRTGGLEDWEFWLQAAAHDLWGYTIPEYLFHYRLHNNAAAKWSSWDRGTKQQMIGKELKRKFKSLQRHFPNPQFSKQAAALPVRFFDSIIEPGTKPIVVVVLPWLQMGGVEQFTLEYMQALKESFQFVVLTTNSAEHALQPEFQRITPHIYHLSNYGAPQVFPCLIKYFVQRFHPSLLVLSHTQAGYALLPYFKAIAPALKVADISHVLDPNAISGGFPGVSVRYTEYIDMHCVASQQLQAWLSEKGVPKGKINVFYIGADVERCQLVKTELKANVSNSFRTADDAFVLFFSGRLTDQKNIKVLPLIAEKLNAFKTNFHLVISGDGPEKTWLEETIYRKKLSGCITLLGTVPHAKNLQLILQSDVLLLPSKWEGIATVLFEAMLMGKPVIATEVGGQKELVTENTGILVPYFESEEAMASAMVEKITLLMKSKDLAAQLGQAARERVLKHFNKKNIFSEMDAAFHQLVKKENSNTAIQDEAVGAYLFQDALSRLSSEQFLPVHLQPQPSVHLLRLKKLYKILTGKQPINRLWSNK